MFKRILREAPPGEAGTVIGAGTLIRGSITAKSSIHIDGEMEGDVNTRGDVVIGAGGKARMDLKARHVTIAGRFEGTLEAEGKLEIKSGGVIVGSVITNGLIIEDGAVFSGDMEMSNGDPAAIPPPEGGGGIAAGGDSD